MRSLTLGLEKWDSFLEEHLHGDVRKYEEVMLESSLGVSKRGNKFFTAFRQEPKEEDLRT